MFPVDFVVLDTKGDSRGSLIFRRPFFVTGKANLDVEIGELILKFNKEKVVFKVYDWTLYMDNLDTCYHMGVKGSKVDKGKRRSEMTGMRVSFAPDMT